MAVASQAHEIPLTTGGSLRLTRFMAADDAPRNAILLWHDAMASGRIFHASTDMAVEQAQPGTTTGLAPWLAARGFDVAVIDQRGRGGAAPRPARDIRFDQTDVIVDEIPAALAAWRAISGARRTHVIAHGWSGVMMAAHLARFPEARRHILSQVYLGTRRQSDVTGPASRKSIDWRLIRYGTLLRTIYGYVPARHLKLGSEDEYAGTHRQRVRWLREEDWRDERDGFDYGRALIRGGLPPTLHIAGNGDEALGHPADVARFRDECGPHQGEFKLLGSPSGLSREYGHDDMLSGERSSDEVFPIIEAWLEEYVR